MSVNDPWTNAFPTPRNPYHLSDVKITAEYHGESTYRAAFGATLFNSKCIKVSSKAAELSTLMKPFILRATQFPQVSPYYRPAGSNAMSPPCRCCKPRKDTEAPAFASVRPTAAQNRRNIDVGVRSEPSTCLVGRGGRSRSGGWVTPAI